MKTKTVNAVSLNELLALLERKRATAAEAAAASKAAKDAVEALGLPAESILLKADDRSAELLAAWNERAVREIPARVDKFHSFKQVK